MHGSIQYAPDCDKTEVRGTIYDSDLTTELADVRLRVCIEGEYWCADLKTPIGRIGPGHYDATLGAEGPRQGSWWVVIVDASGRELSERVRFQTDTGTCTSGGTGRQVVTIDFKKNY